MLSVQPVGEHLILGVEKLDHRVRVAGAGRGKKHDLEHVFNRLQEVVDVGAEHYCRFNTPLIQIAEKYLVGQLRVETGLARGETMDQGLVKVQEQRFDVGDAFGRQVDFVQAVEELGG